MSFIPQIFVGVYTVCRVKIMWEYTLCVTPPFKLQAKPVIVQLDRTLYCSVKPVPGQVPASEKCAM
jgi:hypothetical protein